MPSANVSAPGMTNVLTSQVEQQLNPGQTSQGINQLDSLLLGGNPTAMQTVQSAADPYSTLNDYINQQNNAVNSAISAGQTGAQQASQNTQSQLANTVNQFNTGLTNELGTAAGTNSDYNKNIDAIRSALQSGDLSGLQGVNPGLTDFYKNSIAPWETSISKAQGYSAPNLSYVNAFPTNTNVAAPTLANTATSQDYAKLSALNNLQGSPITSPLSMDTANQAGTYAAGPALAPANNNAIAQDMLDYLNGTTGNVSISQLQQGNDYSQALQNYLGIGGPDTSTTVPVIPQMAAAHGGEVPEIDRYLDSKKVN